MGQSDLYKWGSGVAQNVDVVSDSARDLGVTDIGDVNSTILIDTEGEPRLGDVGVHNTVSTDISAALQSTASDDPLEVLAEIVGSVDTDIGSALNNQDTLDINLATAAAAIEIANQVDTDVGVSVNANDQLDINIADTFGNLPIDGSVSTDIDQALDGDNHLEVSLANQLVDVATDIAVALDANDHLEVSIADALTQIDTDVGAAVNGDDEVTVHDPEAQNHGTVTSFVHDVANTMPSNAVPDGVEVQFQADPNNSSNVTVEDIVLPAGGTIGLEITNTDVVTTGGTGTINVIYEG